MKKLLTLFIISSAVIASDSYHDFFGNYFPEDNEIRKQCFGPIEKNPFVFGNNHPHCKKIITFLNECSKDSNISGKTYSSMPNEDMPGEPLLDASKKWSPELHIPIAVLLKHSNHIDKDKEHSYAEGLARSLLITSAQFDVDEMGIRHYIRNRSYVTPGGRKEFATKYPSRLGVAKHYLNLMYERQKSLEMPGQ